MKKRIFLLILLFVGIAYCGATNMLMTSCGSGGSGGSSANTIATPSLASIRTALGASNTYGMVPALALGAITFPVCTKSDGSEIDYSVTYAITGLPSWLAFDATTRAVALASGAAIPTDAYTASEVTYTCSDSNDSSITASQALTINDLDGGGATDGMEYKFGVVPLLNNNGWFVLDPGNVSLYRAGSSTFRVPTAIVKSTAGMNPADASDEPLDYDGDQDISGGGTNLEEIANGTDLFVYKTSASFSKMPTDLTTGTQPFFVTSADFNNDSKMDFAVTNYFVESSISIFLGVGDGTFSKQTDVPNLGKNPYAIVSADFDEDGEMDLASTNYGMTGNATTLSLYLGGGDGSFTQTGTNYDTGIGPIGLTVSDFNNDGHADLAAANTEGGLATTASVFLGNGDGTMTKQADVTGLAAVPFFIVSADFNKDGYVDLAISNVTDSKISVVFGDGDGTFGTPVAYTTGVGPIMLVAADFDNDGSIDIANTNYGLGGAGTTVSVIINNGDGTFNAAESYSSTTGPWGIAAADLSGDGYADLAVTNFTNGAGTTISVFLNDGDGTFTKQSDVTVGTAPRGIALADFNGDGAIDIANANLESDSASILLNQ